MSKYCTYCGNELMDQAAFCPKCGCPVQGAQPIMQQPTYQYQPAQAVPYGQDGLTVAAKVLLIIGCVFSGFFWLVPLAWTIPMTVSFCDKIKRGEKISTGFAVCILLFLSLVGGILILCNDKIMQKD